MRCAACGHSDEQCQAAFREVRISQPRGAARVRMYACPRCGTPKVVPADSASAAQKTEKSN